MSAATQNLIVLGGAALIGVNVWFGPGGGGLNLSNIVPYYTGNAPTVATEAHRELVLVVFGFVGLWVLWMIAGVSDGAADAGLAFVGGLLLLWMVERSKNGTQNIFSHQGGTTGPATSGTNTQGAAA